MAAAAAAFHAYEQDRSRTFPRARFLELGREDVLETLRAGGLLVPAGDERVAFFHHWYHHYLASKHVAERPELWNFENRHPHFQGEFVRRDRLCPGITPSG